MWAQLCPETRFKANSLFIGGDHHGPGVTGDGLGGEDVVGGK